MRASAIGGSCRDADRTSRRDASPGACASSIHQATIACGAPSARATISPMSNACSPAAFSASIGRSRIARRNDDHHADAAVEDAMHLVVGDVALRLQPVEDRRPRPACACKARLYVIGQHPRHVEHEPAAGDVRHALDAHALRQREHRLHVDARRGEQRVAERGRRAANRTAGAGRRSRRRRCGGSAKSRSSADRSTRCRATRSPAAMFAAVDDRRSFRRRRRRIPRGRTRRRETCPGCSAVSPPISAQPASSQPCAMPLITSAATSTSSRSQTK